MEALGWIKSQLLSVLAPSYSAHLEAQRRQVAENAETIRTLQEVQDRFRLLLGKLQGVDANLGTSLTELASTAQRAEDARRSVLAVAVEGDATLEKTLPEVLEEMELLLRWIKFNEPGGAAAEVDRFLESHHRQLSEGLKTATLEAQVARREQEATRLEELCARAASTADNLNALAQRVAEIAAEKSGQGVQPTNPNVDVVKA